MEHSKSADKIVSRNALVSLFKGTNKYQEAIDTYQKAVNQYKLDKNWSCLVDVLNKMAECYKHIDPDDSHGLNAVLSDLYLCYKKLGDHGKIVGALHHLTSNYLRTGNFMMAAKYTLELAEYYEAQTQVDAAIVEYIKAIDYFEMNGTYAGQINKCRDKLAVLYLMNNSYNDAGKVFETLAISQAAEPLLKYKSAYNIISAILCHLCLDDMVVAERLLDTYMKQDLSFEDTTDCKFIVSIIKDFISHDHHELKNHCMIYDQFRKLDHVQLNLLLKIRDVIQNAEDSLI